MKDYTVKLWCAIFDNDIERALHILIPFIHGRENLFNCLKCFISIEKAGLSNLILNFTYGKSNEIFIDFNSPDCLLAKCIIKNKIELFKLLLQIPIVDVNLVHEYSKLSPLIFAIQTRRYEMISSLLQHSNIDVNYQIHTNDKTALMWAYTLSQEKIVKQLLHNKNINLFLKDNIDKNALNYSKNLEIRNFMLQKLNTGVIGGV